MQRNVYGKLSESLLLQSLWKLRALQKCLWGKWYLYLWKVLVLRRFLDKMQQMSAGSWVKAFCSMSVKSGVISIKVKLLCHCGMCGLSEDSLIKCKQMSMRSWVKAFWSISAETAGSQKMPLRKVILLSLWKVWVLRRFFDKGNKWSWVKTFCSISVKSAGFQKALM